MLHDSSLDSRAFTRLTRRNTEQSEGTWIDDAMVDEAIAGVQHVTMESIAMRAELAALQKRVKELTSENERLEEELRFKDEFFGGMNHELRTPLNAILGLTEALQEQVMGAMNERQLRLLNGIDQSGRNMLALIGDVFDVARAESSDLPLELDSISAETLHDSILRLVKPNLYKNGVRLESSVSAEMPFFLGDKRRIKHMLVTLMASAIRTAKKGDTLNFDIVSNEQNQTIVFKLFNANAIQSEPTTEQAQMADIAGLISIAHTADRHGGSVQVDEIGSGRQFVITLPWRGMPASKADDVMLPVSDYTDMRQRAGLPMHSDKAPTVSA